MAPYGFVERTAIPVEGLIGEPELLEAQHHVGSVQEADDDLLAVDGRQRGDTHVDRPAAHGEADTAVLGDAPLGDVEVGHDLEPGDDAGLEPLGDGHDLVQHAVVPEPDQKVPCLGLKMDIRRPFVGRSREHAVDQLDDRGGLDLLADVAHVVDDRIVLAGRDFGFQTVCEWASDGAQLAQHLDDLFVAGQPRLDVEAGEDAQVIDGDDVRGVGHGHEHGVLVYETHGDSRVPTSVALRDEFEGDRVDPGDGQVQVLASDAAGKRLHEVALGHPALREGYLPDALMRDLLLGRRLVDLLLGEQAHVDEHFTRRPAYQPSLRVVLFGHLHGRYLTSPRRCLSA